MGVWDCGVGPSGFFLGWGYLYKYGRVTLGKEIMRYWELWMGDAWSADASLIYRLSKWSESMSWELLSTQTSHFIPTMLLMLQPEQTNKSTLISKLKKYTFMNVEESFETYKVIFRPILQYCSTISLYVCTYVCMFVCTDVFVGALKIDGYNKC